VYFSSQQDTIEKTNMLENSSTLLSAARESGSTIIHAPISFEPGHDEIADTAYGILAGVKEGSAFTRGEWGADFSRTYSGILLVGTKHDDLGSSH